VIKLYGGTFSRAAIVQWYLEEMQIPYEFVLVDLATGDHFQPEYLALHPFAKVPAITDGDFVLWETGAILTYLSGLHDTAIETPEQLAILNQWVIFANTTLSDGLFAPTMQAKETPHLLGKLDAILAHKTYVLDDRFSAADIAVASLLSYALMMVKGLDFSPYPNVSAYLQRMRDRPAFQKTIGAPMAVSSH
jgi:glutathione S-transferase